MYEKILLAYDGSEQSGRALDQAKEIATAFKSKLEVVHVYAYLGFQFGEAFVTVPQTYEKDHYEYAQRVIQRAEYLTAALSDVKITMLQGSPAREIVNYAATNGFNLIIIGSRGLGGIKELVLGSVSHNVVQHAKIPVLIVK